MARNDDKEENDDFAAVSRMADRLKLKGRDRAKYVHDHMTGFGYRMVPSYVRDEDDDRDTSRFFGGKSGRSRRSDGDEDDGYPF